MLERPVHEIFEKTEGSDFFFQNLNQNAKLDTRKAFKQFRLKYKDDLKI